MKSVESHQTKDLNPIQEKELVKKIGQRFLSEANDLKRTFKSICDELALEEHRLEKILSGESSYDEAVKLAQILSSNYPVKLSDLLLDIPDHFNGVKMMRYEDSVLSKRIFNRPDKDGNRTPYYEYRDTATAKMSPFKPEWIKELRVVDNPNPENPDVAYNNGHFLHQMTAFIGPVNFYWEIDGKKYCKEMDSGSSNYITPFIKHSFTSRDSSKPAIIIAVTFASDAGRAKNEFYSIGNERIQSYILDNRDPNKALTKLIKQIIEDKCLNVEQLANLASKKGIELNLVELLDPNSSKSEENLGSLSTLLNVMPGVFEIPSHHAKNDVEVKDHDVSESFIFNSNPTKPDYIINRLAGNNRMPLMNGFNLNVVSKKDSNSSKLTTSLHSYLFNHGESDIEIQWSHDGEEFKDTIRPNDSMYLEPKISHKFWKKGEANAALYIFRVGGEINLSVQKEISSFANSSRMIENIAWFN